MQQWKKGKEMHELLERSLGGKIVLKLKNIVLTHM
jgi:hypothetical protein